MALTLERLLFDAADAAEGPNVGAFIRGANGDVITSTDVAGKKSLDVRVSEGINVEVDLDFADDSVTAHQGGSWIVDAAQSGSWIVDAVQSGSWIVDAVQSGAWTVTATATDLDIRDLQFASDSVDVSGSTVNATVAAPNGTVLATAITVANTATLLPASALANRKKIEIQNKDDKSIFIGGSGVTTATGIEVSKGGVFTMDLGPSAAIYAISAAGSAPVRVLEIS